jgi:hypothetical protein
VKASAGAEGFQFDWSFTTIDGFVEVMKFALIILSIVFVVCLAIVCWTSLKMRAIGAAAKG